MTIECAKAARIYLIRGHKNCCICAFVAKFAAICGRNDVICEDCVQFPCKIVYF